MSTGVVTPRALLIARLRSHVRGAASELTLTCQFTPGGRVRGAGVVSHFHCVHCNQSRMWHDVAAAIRELEGETSAVLVPYAGPGAASARDGE